jgi:hypothetical protein
MNGRGYTWAGGNTYKGKYKTTKRIAAVCMPRTRATIDSTELYKLHDHSISSIGQLILRISIVVDYTKYNTFAIRFLTNTYSRVQDFEDVAFNDIQTPNQRRRFFDDKPLSEEETGPCCSRRRCSSKYPWVDDDDASKFGKSSSPV